MKVWYYAIPLTPYETGRSSNGLKVKPHEDAQCLVTGYKPGSGKYAQHLGAILCQMDNGIAVALGSGLSDADRQNPPAIGTGISFKYQGLTTKGQPRHPVYWRPRPLP